MRYAWANSYSPAANEHALDSIANEPAPYKISHLASRLFFRGIYFPQKGAWQWLKLIAQNRRSIWRVVRDSFTRWHGTHDRECKLDFNQDSRSPAHMGQPEPEEACYMQADRATLGIPGEPGIELTRSGDD